MHEAHAITIADALGGQAWQPVPGLWQVVVPREDGSLVVIEGGAVSAYPSEAAYEDGEPETVIELD